MRTMLWGSLAAFTFIVIVVIDVLAGYVGDTASVRISARQFRSEAAHLGIRTLNLVPNINHRYEEPYRGDLGQNVPAEEPRLFRTNVIGTIASGKDYGGSAAVILFLGGSTTESNEVDESFRFPAIAERLLNEYYKIPLTVLNGGVRGHTTVDSINSLLNNPAYHNATHVVLMHNINDRLLLSFQDGYHSTLGKTGDTSWSKVEDASKDLVSALWDYISYRSNLLFAARMRVAKFHPFTGERLGPVVSENTVDLEDARLDQHIDLYKRYLTSFVRTVRALNKTPFLMTQPLGKESTGQDRFNHALREVASEEEVNIIDIARIVPSDREWLFLPDFIHMNNEGGKALGHIVAGELSQFLGSSVPKEDYRLQPPIDLVKQTSSCLPYGSGQLPGPRHLLIGRAGRYPSFSPSGGKLVFQKVIDGREQIQLYDFQTGAYTTISTPNGTYIDRHPAFLSETVDGKLELVFGSNRGGEEDLYVVEWPSLKQRKLLHADYIHGAIPTKGPRDSIIFPGFNVTDPDLENPDLFLYEKSALTRLTHTPHQEWKPGLSPDGKFVYYIADPSGNLDIYRLNLATLSTELVYASPADEWDPVVSPDGRWLVFASKQSGNWDLYILDLNDDKRLTRQLTFGPEDDWDPSFHNEGTFLAFASVSGDFPRIFGLCLFGERR